MSMTGNDATREALPFSALGLDCRRPSTSDTVVIFVHGILSSSEEAWGHPSWPDLLMEEPDFQRVGIYLFTYRTSFGSGTYSVADAADALRERFENNGLWNLRHIVFVAHSLGGIVVRRFLVANQGRLIASHPVVGLFLVASPSIGSRDANLFSILSSALGHTQASVLRFSPANTSLDELHRDFRTLLNGGQLRIIGRELTEDRPIRLKRLLGLSRPVVEPFAASLYFHDPGLEPLKVAGSDHKSIVKPLYRNAEQHLALSRFLRELPQRAARTRAGAHLVPVNEGVTLQADQLVTGLRERFGSLTDKPRALAALNQAILTTRHYLQGQRDNKGRDAETESRLSDMWIEVGSVLNDDGEPELASLCWVKGHGWADDRVWSDPRFANLPIGLDDLLERLHATMGIRATEVSADLAERRKAIVAIHKNLDRFEAVRPQIGKLFQIPVKAGLNKVTQHVSPDGNAVEFTSKRETARISVDDLAKLPRDERRAIIASERSMRKLMEEWEELLEKGRLSAADKRIKREISAQMAERLHLILGVVRNAMGGELWDHYAAQRAIAGNVLRLHSNAPSRRFEPE